MSTPFARVHHICIAVHDIDAAIAYYESVGIGPWHDYPPLAEFTTLEVPDPDGFRKLVYRYAWIGDFQLQPDTHHALLLVGEHHRCDLVVGQRCQVFASQYHRRGEDDLLAHRGAAPKESRV